MMKSKFGKDAPFVMNAELRTRGWTDRMIENFLPNPDEERANPRYGSAAPMRLYSRQRVLAIEASDDWATMLAKSLPRRLAPKCRVETGTEQAVATEQLLERINGIVTSMRALPFEEVTRRACAAFNDSNELKEAERADRGQYSREWKRVSPNSEPAYLRWITVNYLRQEVTSYAVAPDAISGKEGARTAAAVLRRKAYAAIAEAFPFLAEECAQQMARKYGTTLGGTPLDDRYDLVTK